MPDVITAPEIKTCQVAFCCCGKAWVVDGPNREALIEVARTHCSPETCQTCGGPRSDNRPYLICRACLLTREALRYDKMPLAPEGYAGPVMVDDRFFGDVYDFLEWFDDEAGEREWGDPYAARPVICEPVMYQSLRIAEYLSEQIETDHDGAIDFDWVAPVQAAFDAALAEANKVGTHWWEATDVRPRIPADYRPAAPTSSETGGEA